MPELTLDDPVSIAAASAMALVGGMVRGFAGFGGPAVMLLVLTPFFNPLSVLSKVMVIDLAANLKLLPNSFADVDWPLCLTVSAASLVGILGGTYALLSVDGEIIKQAVALVVAGCTAVMLTGWRYQGRPGRLVQILAGLLSGFALGATCIALVAMLFFFAGPARPAQARANAIYWALITMVFLILVHIMAQTLDFDAIWRALLVGLVYLFGAVLGSLLFQRTGERDFRRAVLWLLACLSIGALLA